MLTLIANSSPARPAQCRFDICPWRINQPPPVAPTACPAYMAEVFKAMEPEVYAGAMPDSLACCVLTL